VAQAEVNRKDCWPQQTSCDCERSGGNLLWKWQAIMQS